MKKSYEIGEEVKCYRIIGYEGKGKTFRYKCECKNCGNIVSLTPNNIRKSKNKGCKKCWSKSFVHEELIGKVFGCYTVVAVGGRKEYRNEQLYVCRCQCGNETELRLSQITRKNHICCLKCRPKYLSRNNGSYSHGMAKTQIHNIWLGMMSRCYAEYNTRYKIYGEKGITVCDEWRGKEGFINFYTWSINNGYREEKASNGRNVLTIDRIDNDKGYSPDNCRWVTNLQQANNKSTNKKIDYNGETHTISEWSRIYNIKYATLRNRLSRGMDFETAVTKPIRVRR